MSKENNKKLGVALLVAMVIFLIAAIVQFCTYAETIKRCTESTDGTVTSVTVKFSTPRSRSIRSSRRNRRYRSIRYTYTYNAAFKVGNNSYTVKGKSKSELYKKDDTAVIYYDPDDPDKSYIEKCPPNKGLQCLLYAGICLVLGISTYLKSR